MEAIPAAHLYHTQYRKLTPPPRVLIIIIIYNNKTLFQEGNTISTQLISLAALKFGLTSAPQVIQERMKELWVAFILKGLHGCVVGAFNKLTGRRSESRWRQDSLPT